MGSITAPSDGNRWIAAEFGDENLYPWILTSFSMVSDFNTTIATLTLRTYLNSFDFADGILPEDVTLSVDLSGNLDIAIYDWVLVDEENDIWERQLIGTDEVPNFISGLNFFGYGTTINGPFEISDSDFDSEETTSSTGQVDYIITSEGDFYSYEPDTEFALYFTKMTFSDGTIWDLRSGSTGGDGSLVINGQDFGEVLSGYGTDPDSGDVFHDSVTGNGGDDTISGDDGDDSLAGNEGDDYLFGGNGDDTLDGGAGQDAMEGGDGDDLYLLRVGDGAAYDLGSGIKENPNQGTDTLRLIGVDPAEFRILSHDAYYYEIGLPDGQGGWSEQRIRVYVGTDGTDFWDRYERIEFDDGTIWTAATAFIASGTDGNDVFYGTQIAESYDGQTGNDTIYGYDGDDNLAGNEGDDYLDGGDDDDNLAGNEGDDYLFGGNGDDTLDGGAGQDAMEGGDGDDLYLLRVGDGAAYDLGSGIKENPNQGTDTLRLIGIDPAEFRIWSHDAYYYEIGLPDGQGGWSEQRIRVYVGTDGADFWDRYERIEFDDGTIWTAATAFIASGTDGNDVFYGTQIAESYDGQTGNDTIYGYDGDDNLAGNEGDDYLDGGDGDDTASYKDETGGNGIALDLAAGTATDSYGDTDQLNSIENVTGSQWNDLISGDVEDNHLIGAEGRDTLVGQDGDDTLDGGNGGDELEGGRGSDLAFGGNKRDIILGGYDDDILIGRAGNDLIKGNRGADSLVGGADDDRLWGGAQGDTIDGGTGNDLVKAGDGRDLVTMGDGADIFVDTEQGGANGRDTVDGGAGEDTLNSWGGNDLLTGGADADIFAFALGSDHDTIADFEDGVDMIDLSAWSLVGGFTDLKVRDVVGGVDVLRDGDPSDQIFLAGLTKADIDTGDFVFV